MTASISLADIAEHFATLEMRCTRCDRQERLSVSRLIDRYGESVRLPDLGTALAWDCDRADSDDCGGCDILFPQLNAITG